MNMTRAMCSRISKRKHAKPSQEVTPEDSKENSPQVVTRQKNYKNPVCPNIIPRKEKETPLKKFQNSIALNKNMGSLRKSERHRKSPFTNKDFVYNVPESKIKTDSSAKRNVLSDQTNSPLSRGTTSNEPLKTILPKQNNLAEKVNPSQSDELCVYKSNTKPHIPVYKTIAHSDMPDPTCNLPPEKKEEVYEFDEVDENEEPLKKKKKKRVTVRKPKTGPKALTINNIKYSSTESLVSLPEKPVRKKKTKTKMAMPRIKPYSSVNNLNENEVTSCSVQSFMSHPPSLILCNNIGLKNKHELSVLHETQSENIPSPVLHEADNLKMAKSSRNSKSVNISTIASNSLNISTTAPNDSHACHDNSIVSHQRCYPSKRGLSDFNTISKSVCGSINDTVPNQVTNCSANVSSNSSHDFLSSTPCKHTSLVVHRNSVFDDTYDRDVPVGLRPSTGFTQHSSANMINDDKCFGFDEPEELEEPLVSPIKNINLQEPRIRHRRHLELPFCNDIENPKPDVKEVIEKLKASIPKAQPKEPSKVFNSDSSSTDDSNPPSPIRKEVETTLSLLKPPRRSYERQRRIRYYSEHEEEDEEDDDIKSDDKQEKAHKAEQGNVPKPANKCYQKKNVSKVIKAPHVPKAKQKIIKEEEELERLAAQMNAQFQAIDRCNLVVE